MGKVANGLMVWMLLLPCLASAAALQTLRFSPQGGDYTPVVQAALHSVEGRGVALIFEPGRYEFHGEYADERYLAITNHDNGLKRVIFPMDRFDEVTIVGNGAEFIFHDRVLPFLFKGCEAVEMSGVNIDWDIPFYFQATVTAVNAEDGWLDVSPHTDGFSWTLRDDQLAFPDVDGFSYNHVGETLAFDGTQRRVAHGAWDFHLDPKRVEPRPDGRLRLHDRPRHFPQVDTVIVAKGKMGENRYAPAIYGIKSSALRFTDVTVHHALGMGFLFERCDGVTLSGCGVYVRDGSARLVSTLADATHFCNCRGSILVEKSRFAHMLDDGTNVHGTYVVVDKVLNDREARVRLMHFQQSGFQFAESGDEVWLINAPDPGRAGTHTVAAYRQLNERYSIITFTEPIGNILREGDLMENKTWNPSFTMRGCTIEDHRARGIVLKTPLAVRIENNHFSSMMSAVFFRGESAFWYESGSVEDVLIRSNRFDYSAYSGMEHAILRVTPRLGDSFDSSKPFDRNIRFIDNTIHTFGNRIVWVDRVAGLQILNNTIIQTTEAPEIHPGTPMIELTNCADVWIDGNRYEGTNQWSVASDAPSRNSLTIGTNTGFQP